jgi:hypothetical protein
MAYLNGPSFECPNCCTAYPATVEAQDELFPRLVRAAEITGQRLLTDRFVREVATGDREEEGL